MEAKAAYQHQRMIAGRKNLEGLDFSMGIISDGLYLADESTGSGLIK